MFTRLITLLLPPYPISYHSLKEEQKICVEFANEMRQMTLSAKLPYIWFHIANEFLPSVRTNYLFDLKQKHMGKISGLPDYCFIGKLGQSFFIEFKSKKGKQSENQKIFEAWCTDNGIDYFLCRSAKEGIELVNSRINSFYFPVN